MDKLLIRKDVFEDIIEKGYGKRDYSKLTKKVITDKNGHKRTVFVKNDVTQTTQKQPKTQELSEEKRAKYEEMLEKVKRGPEERALFAQGDFLNKKDAIAYLENKLGKKSGGNVAQRMANTEDEAFEESEKDAQKKYGNMSIEELKAEAKKYDGVSKYSPEANEARKVYDVLNQKLAAEKKNSKTKTESKSKKFSYDDAVNAIKEGKTVQWKSRDGSWNDVDPKTSELVMARDIGSELRVKPTQDDMKENYLDAKNEAGKDIAENNKINKVSDLIEFSSDEMKAIQDAANKIGYKPGEEGKLLNAIEDKNIYSSLTKKNSEAWKRSGKEQKTFSSTDLLKEKIKSMNGDFGADTEKVSLKDKVKEWEDKGLPKDAAYAKVAFDDLYDGYENKFDEEKEEINEAFRDIQKNGLKAKYFKDHAKEYGLSSDENKTENPDKIKAKEEYMNEVSSWQKRGLPRDAAFAKVALDKIVEEIKNTPKDNVQKLEELDNAFHDVQLNNTRSKYIKNILDIE